MCIRDRVKSVPPKQISDEICLSVQNLKMYFPLYKGLMKRKVNDVRAVEDLSLIHI